MTKMIEFRSPEEFTRDIEKLREINRQLTSKGNFKFKELKEFADNMARVTHSLEEITDKLDGAINPFGFIDKKNDFVPRKEYR